ncbi:hypothetical protein LguiB_007975 [Lonicera macranthoides]
MGDSETIIPTDAGEKHVIAAAQHILKALAVSKNVSNDMRKVLADLDSHLSTMAKLPEIESDRTREIEDRLKCAQKKVITWQSNQSKIWDSGPRVASEYLQAVDEIRRLIETLEFISNKNGKEKEILDRAHTVLQMAMARLEEELVHILAQNKLSFEPEFTSFHSCEESAVYDESLVSTEDGSVEGNSRRESSGTESEGFITDLVHPDVIPDIKSIANIMFASHYDQELCEAFVCFWKVALDEYLIILGVEKLGTETLVKMEWVSLSSKIKKWCRAIKVIVRFFLAGKKRLFDQILGDFGSTSSTCFVEASRASMLCLLDFGEAVAIGPHQPERLFRLVDMYEVLSNLIQDLDVLFAGEVGSFLRTEFHELSRRLANTVRATFVEFGNQVASRTSLTPFPKGGIHHLTKYVMNYIKLVAVYSDALVLLLEKEQDEGRLDGIDEGPPVSHPMAHHLWSLMSILETNLENKSNLYRDGSLKHIFMLNNVHYMVHKVRDSELATYFGDEWIRNHIAKFQQHATSYVRVTWSSVLSLLEENGNRGKGVLKERCRDFTNAFEEVYKSQTEWCVPHLELREDLQISVSQKVIHAYRTFLGRNNTSISEKHIKYTADELELYILDLFGGVSRSLRYPRRR